MKSPRKIAIASVFLGQVARGVESWAKDLAAELHRRKFDVTLFKGGGPAQQTYEEYVPCLDHTAAATARLANFTRHGGWRLGLGSAAMLQQTSFALRLTTVLRRRKFDVVHMQDAWACRVLERTRRLGLHHARVILGHGTEETLEYLLHLEHVQELAPHYLQQDRVAGLPAERKWFAIPNFVDCGQFCPDDQAAARAKFDIPRDRFVVLDIAALKLTHKRLDWLATEVAALRRTHPMAMLVVAGASTDETEAVRTRLTQILGENGRVLADVNRDDMPGLYRSADLFAHAALHEMMPIALLEALASGLPVLAHTAPIFEWVIGHGGITMNMEQAGALAGALAKLIDDPALRQVTATAARQQALANFETSRVVDQIVAMYGAVS